MVFLRTLLDIFSLAQTSKPSKFWRRQTVPPQPAIVYALLNRVMILSMLSLLSVISAGPALAGDPFVSLKMSRLPAGSMAAPFELIARADGRLTLIDTATEARIDLESFGPTNAAVFARLLTLGTASRQP